MPFVQIIEYTTDRIDEIKALGEEWDRETAGKSTATRVVVTEDLDRPGTYVQIVEFPSKESAEKNSNMPETNAFAERMAKLCTTGPSFRNLDVIEQVRG